MCTLCDESILYCHVINETNVIIRQMPGVPLRYIGVHMHKEQKMCPEKGSFLAIESVKKGMCLGV